MAKDLIRLDLDLSVLDRWEDEVIAALKQATYEANEHMRDHASADHGPTAHARKRFTTRTGNLLDSMETIPPVVLVTFVVGGVYAVALYAPYVEERDGEPFYAFFHPLLDDKELHDKIMKTFEYHLKRVV